MSKRGALITCSLCHVKSHNKRGCHLNNQDNEGRGRGRGEEHRLIQQGQVFVLLDH